MDDRRYGLVAPRSGSFEKERTTDLGRTETTVRRSGLRRGDDFSLEPEMGHLLVPIASGAPIRYHETVIAMDRHAVGMSAREEVTCTAAGTASVSIVSAPTGSRGSDARRQIDLDDVTFVLPENAIPLSP